ncbi:hypothetical protein [Actinobacillus pleuropneumoniae]|nr:hypothetical protein [Actinobacillus pleuropneumoniae]MCY6488342.1 hypothetical protein [Actinobacillus pleuropneumoniae]
MDEDVQREWFTNKWGAGFQQQDFLEKYKAEEPNKICNFPDQEDID